MISPSAPGEPLTAETDLKRNNLSMRCALVVLTLLGFGGSGCQQRTGPSASNTDSPQANLDAPKAAVQTQPPLALENIPVGTILPCVKGESLPPSQRLHLINLGVNDIVRSTAFYQALGWHKSPVSHAGYVKFNLNGYALCLIPYAVLADDANLDGSVPPGIFRGIAFVYLARSIEEVALMLEQAVAAGGTLVKPATRTPWGVAGYFKDPDGHLFEIDFETQYVFDGDGKLVVDSVN